MYIWLDALFSNFEWYVKLKEIVIKVIVFAEATGEDGVSKKQKAIDAVETALRSLGLNIPIPDFLQDILIGLMIDLIVGFLNQKFGHDWIQKVKEIIKIDG